MQVSLQSAGTKSANHYTHNADMFLVKICVRMVTGGYPVCHNTTRNFFFNKDLNIYGTVRIDGPGSALSISNMKLPANPRSQLIANWLPIKRCGLKKNASMTSLRCMVYLTGGFKDNDSTLIDTHLKGLQIPVPSDFEDLYLLNLQGHLNHLSPEDKKILTTAVNLWTRNLVIRQRIEDLQMGIESYQTQLNLTKPRWDAKGFEYKHDFIVIDSPRAVTFRDKYGVQMIMRFNEIHKFSDGTLQ
ncbi:hypothetical protein Tco_1182871 [Tanacetum coccineum]